MNYFDEKVVIITGASRGIGRAVCLELCNYNVKLAVCSRNIEELNDLKSELMDIRNVELLISECDISLSESVKEFVDKVIATFGRIDILINNAGVGYFDKFENLDEERWKRMFSTNVDGVFYFCQNAISNMKNNESNPKGIIINIGSTSHLHYLPGGVGYGSSKAAMYELSQYLFNEYREQDILVAYLAVGSVNTGFSKRNPDLIGWKITPDDVAKTVKNLLITLYSCENACISYMEVRAKHPLPIEGRKE